jgi:hypothetical protein
MRSGRMCTRGIRCRSIIRGPQTAVAHGQHQHRSMGRSTYRSSRQISMLWMDFNTSLWCGRWTTACHGRSPFVRICSRRVVRVNAVSRTSPSPVRDLSLSPSAATSTTVEMCSLHCLLIVAHHSHRLSRSRPAHGPLMPVRRPGHRSCSTRPACCIRRGATRAMPLDATLCITHVTFHSRE